MHLEKGSNVLVGLEGFEAAFVLEFVEPPQAAIASADATTTGSITEA